MMLHTIIVMKKNRCKYFGVLLLLLLVSGAFAQQPFDSLVKAFRQHRETAYQEKLFVHLHRTTVLTGEMLWFKVYAVDGSFHKPSTLSKVAYIEIIDKDNKAVLQSKIRLNENGGSGSVFVPATILSGNYTFRAYTQWMRNFHPDFYYHTTLAVINPFVKLETPPLKKGAFPPVIVRFFPEGGNLVQGLKNRVAFKVMANEKPVKGKMFLLSASGDTVVSAEANKFGLGSISFTPQEGVQYRAVFRDEAVHTSFHNVPAAVSGGYNLHVRDSAENLFVTVTASGEPREIMHTFMLVHARQQIIRAESKPLYPRSATYVLPKSALPDGITHITIFDQERNPVCERLYFTVPRQRLKIDLSVDQPQYDDRRKVTLQLTTSLPAGVSVAVYKADSLTTDTQAGIAEYLYLTSDLVGEIDSPEYYLDPANENVQQNADLLMLTHGWRRFNWKDVKDKPKDLSFIPEARGHLISGNVQNTDGSPAPGVLTLMSSPGKIVRLYGSRSNAKGDILFEASDFAGTKKIIVQTSLEKDSLYKITMRSPFSTDFGTSILPPLRLDAAREKELLDRSVSMQLQDIFLGDKTLQATEVQLDSVPFFGTADERYLLDAFTRFPVLEEVMREYVPGVLVRKRRDGFHFIVINKEMKSVLPDDPLVLLDGVPVPDVDDIMSFDPLKIKRLDVVMRNYYLGPLVLPGIVSYSTYEGDLAGFQLDPRAVVVNYEGLQLQREFYVPHYENLKQRNSRVADQRNLLFWNPDVNSKAGEKQQLEFYTSDVSGRFVIIVQGISSNGVAGSGVSSFSVRKTGY